LIFAARLPPCVMADDVVLNTPLIAAPVKGKTAIRRTVEPLLGVVDAFDFREIMLGPEHVSFGALYSGPSWVSERM
jgi:hypothetical protein